MNELLSKIHLTIETVPALSFALLAVVFGAIIAAEDSRSGKIRNKLILTALLCGAALHLLFIAAFAFFTKDYSVRPEYFLAIIINAAIALAAGFFLWKVKIWSAGDAKMFAMFAFLIPLGFYEKSNLPIFPSFNLLINIFAVSVVIVALQAAAGTASSVKELRNRETPDKKKPGLLKTTRKNVSENWPVFVVMFFVFNIFYMGMAKLQRAAGPGIGIALNIAYIAAIFTVLGPVAKAVREIFNKHPVMKTVPVIMIVAAVAVSTTAPGYSDLLVRSGRNVAGYMIFAGLLRRILEIYFEKKDVRKIKAADLQPGHIPATEIKIETPEGVKSNIGSVFVDGLTSEQVHELKSNLAPDAEVEIEEPVAFAPMALAGVVLTLLLKQSVIHYIISLARK